MSTDSSAVTALLYKEHRVASCMEQRMLTVTKMNPRAKGHEPAALLDDHCNCRRLVQEALHSSLACDPPHTAPSAFGDHDRSNRHGLRLSFATRTNVA